MAKFETQRERERVDRRGVVSSMFVKERRGLSYMSYLLLVSEGVTKSRWK